MKLHFEPNLDFQLAAIEAVCDLFKGQGGVGGDESAMHFKVFRNACG